MEVLFAAVAVADFPAARTWYGDLFGRPEDVVVNDHEVMWRIDDAAWLYVVKDPDRAGHGLVTVAVSDLGQAVSQLEGRGIACGPVEVIAGAGRKAPVTDPEGNTVALIQVDAR